MFVLSFKYEFTTYLGPLKKIAAQISYQGCLPKTAQICAACTANWPMLPKNELQKNILYINSCLMYLSSHLVVYLGNLLHAKCVMPNMTTKIR